MLEAHPQLAGDGWLGDLAAAPCTPSQFLEEGGLDTSTRAGTAHGSALYNLTWPWTFGGRSSLPDMRLCVLLKAAMTSNLFAGVVPFSSGIYRGQT